MVTYIHRSIILLSIALLSTACSYTDKVTPSSPPSPEVIDPVKIEPNTMTSATLVTTGSMSVPTKVEPDPSAPRATDKASMEFIMNNPGLAGCDSVTDVTLKTECIDKVMYNKAIFSKNTSVCNEIQSKKMQGMCLVNSVSMDSTGETMSPCETIVDTEIQSSCILADATRQAISKMDPSLCNAIVNSEEQSACKYNVVITKSLKNKDPNTCLEMEELDQADKCREVMKGIK